MTNFPEVYKNIKKLQDLSAKLKDEEEKAKYTKKEIGLWEKERQRLEGLYGGISEMIKVPDALFIIDSHMEELAVKEALNVGVPTVAIVDTNADPHLVSYPIPANDDAAGSIELITSYLIDAWNEGAKIIPSTPASEAEKKIKAEPKTEQKPVKKAAKKTEEKEKKTTKTIKKTAKAPRAKSSKKSKKK